MHDGSVKACFDKRIGSAKLASPVKASFDAPILGHCVTSVTKIGRKFDDLITIVTIIDLI